MAIELRVPSAGESISEVEVGEWLKHPGDHVEVDETVVVLDSDKAALELPAPAAGTLIRVLKETGSIVRPGDLIGIVAEEGEEVIQGSDLRGPTRQEAGAPGPAAKAARPVPPRHAEAAEPEPLPMSESAVAETAEFGAPPGEPVGEEGTPISAETAPARAAYQAGEVLDEPTVPIKGSGAGRSPRPTIQGAGALPLAPPRPGGSEGAAPPREQPAPPSPPNIGGVWGGQAPERTPVPGEHKVSPLQAPAPMSRQEEAVPMTHLRRRIAARLVEAQQTAALLTTFNEVDMTAVMALRKELQPLFQERYDVKLGFMSFFVKASVEALKLIPEVNAEIREDSIIYRNYYDIGVAIGGGRGLVVPVLRNAERLSFAEIESAIGDLARRAQENKLRVDELQGGTFTISNGGVYGSLLSTPIVNPPQSGILGMHAIQDRPVARDGQVVIRPMMYVALTYDHRIVDGREAVTFLRRIKECVEEPTRILLEV